jgi:hypothetical protein
MELQKTKTLLEDRITFFSSIIESQGAIPNQETFSTLLSDFKKANEYIDKINDAENKDDEEKDMMIAFLYYNTSVHIKAMIDRANKEKSDWRNQSMVMNIESSISNFKNCLTEIQSAKTK